jgi:hypothetical protein
MSLIEKYKINIKDLYIISLIEAKKKRAGFVEKEKLKASALSVLKPYNVKFFDIGNLLNEIEKNNYHLSLENNFSLEEKKEIEDSIQMKSNVKSFYQDWWEGRSKKQKITYILILFFLVLAVIGQTGEKIGSINQELTNNYSGEYEGVYINGIVQVETKISIDPIKYEGKNTYSAYVTGTSRDNFGNIASLQKSKFTLTLNDNHEPIEMCLKDKYGSSLLGGNPCSIKFDANSIIVLQKGYSLKRINNRFHDWTKKNK